MAERASLSRQASGERRELENNAMPLERETCRDYVAAKMCDRSRFSRGLPRGRPLRDALRRPGVFPGNYCVQSSVLTTWPPPMLPLGEKDFLSAARIEFARLPARALKIRPLVSTRGTASLAISSRGIVRARVLRGRVPCK